MLQPTTPICAQVADALDRAGRLLLPRSDWAVDFAWRAAVLQAAPDARIGHIAMHMVEAFCALQTDGTVEADDYFEFEDTYLAGAQTTLAEASTWVRSIGTIATGQVL